MKTVGIIGGIGPISTLDNLQTNLALGKTATVSEIVTERNTAKAVGSGSLDVYATPMMIALMERAACDCLTDCLSDCLSDRLSDCLTDKLTDKLTNKLTNKLEPEQTSVGTKIEVSHNAASPLGAEITATATIKHVSGRQV